MFHCFSDPCGKLNTAFNIQEIRLSWCYSELKEGRYRSPFNVVIFKKVIYLCVLTIDVLSFTSWSILNLWFSNVTEFRLWSSGEIVLTFFTLIVPQCIFWVYCISFLRCSLSTVTVSKVFNNSSVICCTHLYCSEGGVVMLWGSYWWSMTSIML